MLLCAPYAKNTMLAKLHDCWAKGDWNVCFVADNQDFPIFLRLLQRDGGNKRLNSPPTTPLPNGISELPHEAKQAQTSYGKGVLRNIRSTPLP